MSKRSRIVRRRMRAHDRRERDNARNRCIVWLEAITVDHDHVLTWDMVRMSWTRCFSESSGYMEIRVPRLGKPTIAIPIIVDGEITDEIKEILLEESMFALEHALRHERWGHMIPKPGASVSECRKAEGQIMDLYLDQLTLYGTQTSARKTNMALPDDYRRQITNFIYDQHQRPQP